MSTKHEAFVKLRFKKNMPRPLLASRAGTILCLCKASFQRLNRIPCVLCVIRKIELTLRNTIAVLMRNLKAPLYSLCNNQRLSAKFRERERERERERGVHLP